MTEKLKKVDCMSMKVYQIIYTEDYGGGLAVVTANSPEEALDVFVRDSNSYLDRSEVECKLLEGVVPTVKFASLLAEDFYYE